MSEAEDRETATWAEEDELVKFGNATWVSDDLNVNGD